MTNQVASRALEMLRQQSSLPAVSPAEFDSWCESPEWRSLTPMLDLCDSLERVRVRMMGPGLASYFLHAMFTPAEVPSSLYQIYEVLEDRDGVIITFNYDRITDRQSRFRVIAAHGQTSELYADPSSRKRLVDLARDLHRPIPNDWHLLYPEDDHVRSRREYLAALEALGRAQSVVVIGYAFGGGDDALSFEDFCANLNPKARVHVLGPATDNADLVRQVGYGLRGRGSNFRVWPQAFSVGAR